MNAPFLCAHAITQSTPVLMQMVIQQQHLPMLRQALACCCRREVEILLLKPCQTAMVKVCFLVSQHLLDAVMHQIMQTLPAAQFGRYHEISEHGQAQVIAQLEQDYAASDPYTLRHEHTCPICQRVHLVNSAMHALAYGQAFTCSLACELKRRQHWWHFAPVPLQEKR